MKTVYMVFNDKEKISVSASLYANFKYVFEDYVKVKTCFLDEVEPADIADGDLFIVLYRDRVYSMKDYTSSLDKVIVLTRTIQKQFLPDIFSIPEGADVLVVNDSDESTLQTANTLYALGLNHLNLIPFEQNADPGRYRHIPVAITPNEVKMVPPFINKVINIQDRYIDLFTFVSIINKLDLNNERITRNLIKYTGLIAGTDTGINQKYVTDHLKSEMLKKVIHNSHEAILLTDTHYMTVYANDKAQTLFGLETGEGSTDLRVLLQSSAIGLSVDEDYDNKLLQLGGTNYIVNKNAVMILDQVVGYSILLDDEKDIKNIGNDLNKQLAKTGLVAKYSFDNILCCSESMHKCISLAKKVALTDYTVLLSGESGTGKELVAQSIHSYSNRMNNPFVAINCAALPESLLESELFGYEKGAFTGASGNGKLGLFEQASNGTIFLDEIGDMSLTLQARLLRVLQEKQIMRLGSDKLIDIDIRIIAATNKDLAEAVKQRTFREDLYYRLCNIPVVLPALRQRRADILYILKHFLGPAYDRLTETERFQLENYAWPGNVRELKNAADYYQTLGELPAAICASTAAPYASSGTFESLKAIGFPAGSSEFTGSAELLRLAILRIIADHTEENRGIGRTSILRELDRQGTVLSDDKARKYLRRLEADGLIRIGKGRAGCCVTDSGMAWLKG